MRKIICYAIMLTHLAVAIFYSYQLYFNADPDAKSRLVAVLFVATIVFVLSIFACLNWQAMMYSLFSYVLVIGLLVWVGRFVFSGVYVFTLAASILVLLDERRGRF